MFKNLGPGVLVAAAFIGPGTITTCILAGVTFGYTLLWAMVLSTAATIVLQEMSARLGVITQNGIAAVIRSEIKSRFFRNAAIGIILTAIVLGSIAYEGGNISGGALGLEAIFGPKGMDYYPGLIGIFAFTLLYRGNYKMLETVFISLVVVMSCSFLITAIITRPNLDQVLAGILFPKVPSDGILTVAALVGTTIVPYNLFLHASLVSERWKVKGDLKWAQRDTFISVALGGTVSLGIIIAAAAIPGKSVQGVLDLAQGLAPLYGNAARYGMGIGLFAAGVTSAITAPLASAYVAANCFGWRGGLKDGRFRSVWIGVLIFGVLFTTFGIEPIEMIKFAQVANGILLPFTAIFLLWAVNRPTIMGKHLNSTLQNILGLFIMVLAVLLGVKSIIKVFSVF